jgi:hypothetical protein
MVKENEINELRLWLEWGGSRLLSMRLSSPSPKSHRVAWPEYAPDPNVAYGYGTNRLRAAIPSSEEIELMDAILALIAIIDTPLERRIVSARSLVTPITSKYLYSWSTLATMLHLDRRTVAGKYKRGLGLIHNGLPSEKRDGIRKTLDRLTT